MFSIGIVCLYIISFFFDFPAPAGASSAPFAALAGAFAMIFLSLLVRASSDSVVDHPVKQCVEKRSKRTSYWRLARIATAFCRD